MQQMRQKRQVSRSSETVAERNVRAPVYLSFSGGMRIRSLRVLAGSGRATA